MNVKLIMMMESVRSFFKREEGASAIEYALIAGLISIAVIAFGSEIGTAIEDIFETIKDALDGAAVGGGA